MIIWGLKKKIIAKGSIQTIECPQCKNRDFTLNGILRYIHIFWIPLFTVQKKAIAQCSNCNLELDNKSLSTSLRKELKRDVFPVKLSMLYNFGILSFCTVISAFALYVISLM